MHPPPIIFKNQDTNDIPITSGTYTNAGGIENQEAPQHHHYNHAYASPSVGSLIRDNNRSPFVVDIQSINFGMSNEDGESNGSAEIGDENAAQLVHAHAPSIHDHAVVDQHKDDDYENEQGEVIQESNAVPQLVSSDQSISDNLNQIPDFAKPTTKQAYKDPKIPFTQTEANSLWERYPSTSELYSVSFTPTDRASTLAPTTIDTLMGQHNAFQYGTSTANRHPFGVPNQVHLQIPSIAPSLVNDMYALTTAQNRSQTVKPLQPTRSPNFVTRNPSHKQIYYGGLHHQQQQHQQHQYHHGPQSIEPRPPKFTNIGTPHHLTLQNLPVPPHFVGPLFAADNSAVSGGSHRPPHSHPYHSRRPIAINQKPFSRYPVHYNKPIPTNYSVQHVNVEPIKPNWHSSKPFDASHFGPLNVPQQQQLTSTTTAATTRQPQLLASTQNDQSLQTSEIHHNSISTHRPFAKTSSNKPDTEMAMITHYTDPSTNITQAASGAANDTSDLFDLTRGKPFVMHAPSRGVRPTQSHLNIGEENRPANVNKTMDGELLQADIFDYHEQNSNKAAASVTEPNLIETTDTGLSGITNPAFIPFGEKVKVNPIQTAVEREVYPKTPATEMQPPPTHATQFKPYIQKHVPAISPPTSSSSPSNVLIEGLHPPPIPKLSVKQKMPSEIHGNYGKVSMAHNLHSAVHKPNQGFYSITAPTHYPEAPAFATTHHQQPQHHNDDNKNADSDRYSGMYFKSVIYLIHILAIQKCCTDFVWRDEASNFSFKLILNLHPTIAYPLY